ncbi:GreA/GreB family elongation factor [Luteolibacter sp. GHJ8]|uniref:GreA/GreB family elongation factor n=1 Tax=Luteolibacter rhizosphaerae TaxID=2989719 RepID=A0ABT3G5B1_9BACT|nr:GreA/GreB family elongation factor [Luteolibacter rhizosphaerae]MCW1915051.1 GreA/GreB family elongation factor [Luteolibacter rhizosphaerae]
MNSPRLLNEGDLSRLASLLENRLTTEHRNQLLVLLGQAASTRDAAELECRVALGDRITLVSPLDSRDWYKPEIVLPDQVDLDEDIISVMTPVGLAVLGRRIGDRVSWETPAGTRWMTITAVHKHVLS